MYANDLDESRFIFLFMVYFFLERALMTRIGESILGFLDFESMQNAELVSDSWEQVVVSGKLYKKWLEQKVHANFVIFFN